MPFLIRIEKQYLKFSAAHFTLFHNGRETLHGHNYMVSVEVEGENLQGGLLIDFFLLKDTVLAICDRLDEKILIPNHSRVQCREEEKQFHFTVDDEASYSVPADEVVKLPVENITCESLAWYFYRLLSEARKQWDTNRIISRLRVWVEETPGQRGGYESVLD